MRSHLFSICKGFRVECNARAKLIWISTTQRATRPLGFRCRSPVPVFYPQALVRPSVQCSLSRPLWPRRARALVYPRSIERSLFFKTFLKPEQPGFVVVGRSWTPISFQHCSQLPGMRSQCGYVRHHFWSYALVDRRLSRARHFSALRVSSLVHKHQSILLTISV